MLQIGSADEIIGSPNDPYVEKFVQGSSRLKLLKAETVMLPLEQFESVGQGQPLADAPRLRLDTPIEELLGLSNRHGNTPMVVIDESGADVGVITASSILRGVHERL
ncbi:hypothetical protein ACFSQT_15960 [Mesorhizobium calcicola]